MKKIVVNFPTEKQKGCSIFVGKKLLEKINDFIDLRKYSSITIITDTNVEKYHLKILSKALPTFSKIVLFPGENQKNIKTVEKIWKNFRELNVDRKSLIINLGGGVVGDMGGFAAATYMRGIDFLQIPTSLLAQVDASVGGKVGVNFDGIKNLVGSFQQPIGVVIDVETLHTLPVRDFLEGFGEIIKHGLISDKEYFEFVISKKPQKFSSDELVDIVSRSCEIKARIVEVDEREIGFRKVLNFGHTIGHALETISLETKKPLLHGEAISIGMVAESYLSFLKGMISESDFSLIKKSLSHAGLPINYPALSLIKVKDKIIGDKKNSNSVVYWTLLDGIGKTVFDQQADEALVTQAINFITDQD